MQEVSYIIASWSNKIFKARYRYLCDNCGGVIAAGTKYIRHVERLGQRKGIDPLRNLHVHTDCSTPWYLPENGHRLKCLGTLPKLTPLSTGEESRQHYPKPSVVFCSSELGQLVWQLPETLAIKIVSAKRHSPKSTLGELEQTLSIVLLALVQAGSKRKKAMKLNHLITAIARELEPITPK